MNSLTSNTINSYLNTLNVTADNISRYSNSSAATKDSIMIESMNGSPAAIYKNRSSQDNLAKDTVDLMNTKNAISLQTTVFKKTNEMIGTLLDIFA